jgi:hypothetical protein
MALICRALQFLCSTRVEPIAALADRLPRRDLEQGPRDMTRQAKIIREQLLLLLQPGVVNHDQCISTAYEASRILFWDLWELFADSQAMGAAVGA